VVPAPPDPEATEKRAAVIELAVLGAVPSDLLVALAVGGIAAYVVTDDQPVDGAAAIYAPGATVDAIRVLTTHAIPIVTDADAGDVARLTHLVRAGAADVIPRPVTAEDLARRITRATRRRG
jgi:hypothetical protein